MKFTEYFKHTRLRPDREVIKEEWIEAVFYSPDFEQIQTDNRIRRWKYIPEADKHLRIVILEDNCTVHNAFFDRSFSNIKNKNS
jgi:hypothetical protein